MVDFSLGKKKEDDQGTPTDKVIQFRRQGLSNDQIVSYLQREGYKANQIFEAFTQADLKESISGSTEMPPVPPVENPMQNSPGIIPSMRRDVDTDQVQEIAEKIIEEKWDTVVDNINKIIDWKEGIDSEIANLKNKINSLNENIASVQRALSSKVEDYDKTMRDVGTDVKALTMVFQKILPGFMENVQELSKITDKIKGGKQQIVPLKSKKSKSEQIFEEEKSIEDIE